MGANPCRQVPKSCGKPSQRAEAVSAATVLSGCNDQVAYEEKKPEGLTLFTVRPASLLCRFIAERASGRFSLASANSLDTSTPNSASSLQPPHFQPSPGGPLWWESQPHMVDVPSAQERVTANATPADAMAWTNADSRVAEREIEGDRKRETRKMLQTRQVSGPPPSRQR